MDSEHPYGHLKGKISDYGHISERGKKKNKREKKETQQWKRYVCLLII